MTLARTRGRTALSLTKMPETDCMLYVSLVLKLNYWNAPRTQALPHCDRDATSIAADAHRARILVDQIERKAGQANHPELCGSSLASIDQRIFCMAA